MSPGGKRSSTDPPRPTPRSRPIAWALLLALAALLPFEAPILDLGPLTITTVELALYLLLATWAAGMVARTARAGSGRATWTLWRTELVAVGRDPVARVVALWLAVVLLCALAAPAHRVPAFKSALRTLGGGLLFFAARGLIRSAADSRAVILAILVGAILSAGGAVAETVFPNSATLWHHFRPGTFTVTGLPRPSGPFGYPTIAAMYWEAALPLVVVLAVPARADKRSGGSWTALALSILAAAILIAATLFSATRTALAVSALASVAMLALLWRTGLRARVATGTTLVLIALLAISALSSPSGESQLALRLRWWQDGTWYRARYTVTAGNPAIVASSLNEIPLIVENTGGLFWPRRGGNAVHLSYHWEKTDALGTHLDFEGRRSLLPSDVPPGGTTRVLASVRAPDRPGTYKLRWDLVRENVTWFSEHGTPTADQYVEVVPAGPGATLSDRSTVIESSLEDWMLSESPTRPDLWRAAVRLWRRQPLLGVGPDNFRRLYPEAIMPRPKLPLTSYDTRLHANSLYFETLADLGIVGALTLALLIVTLGRAAWPQLRVQLPSQSPWSPWPPSSSLLRILPSSVACVVALGTFFVHGLLDCFLAFTPTYGLFWLLMALVAASAPPPRAMVTNRES